MQQSDLASSIFKSVGRTLIFGSEQSGKTTFSKRLILEARARKLSPVYLDIADLTSINRGEIRGWFNSAIEKQYDADCRKRVADSSPDSVILILDNAQTIPGGIDGIELVLEFLSVKSDRLLILTSENPAVSILSAQGQQEYKYWRSANVLELLPLGHRRRGELIRKWVALGRTYLEALHEIEAEVRQVKLLLDRALGKSALPKYPLFILALLQQIEGVKQNKTSVANGSHGYLFEALVSQAIDRHVRSHEIGAVTDFLAAIAHLSWQRGGAPLSKSAIDGLLQAFREKLVKVDGDTLFPELERAKILLCDGHSYQFRYQYLYYYYLAKWVGSRAEKTEGIEFVEQIVSLVHTELSANVLMFLAHFGKEQLVIDKLVPLMDSLFSDQEPCKLEDRSSLSSRYSTARQRAVLLQGPPIEVSDAHHEGLDQHEVDQEGALQIEDSLKLNTTLKALHVLGQVLKSRATSIPKEEMVRIANSSMLGARRFMNFAYEIIEENAEGMVHGVSEAFEKAFKLSKPKAVGVATAVMGLMVLSVARLGVIRAADTMGAAELEPLLEHLEAGDPDEDTRLILLVAKIVGEKNYPKEEVEDFVRSLGASNVLPVGVLAAAVAQRFYLDPPDRSIREGACALLGIDQKSLPPKSKKPEIYMQHKR